MSLDRLILNDSGGSTDPSPTNSTAGNTPLLSRKLPPLIQNQGTTGHGLSGNISLQSIHQTQLEMEYEKEEGYERGSDGLPSIRGWMDWTSHQNGTEPKGDSDAALKDLHALYAFDMVDIPPSVRRTSPLLGALCRYPAARRWARWRWRQPPQCTNTQAAEAVALYERGMDVPVDNRCDRCRAGRGVSPQCVVAPAGFGWGSPESPAPCSNCLFDGIGNCCTTSSKRPSQQYESINGTVFNGLDAMVDQMAVLEMISQLKTPSKPEGGSGSSMPAKAARIEAAALQIAEAAREWGEKMAGSG